MFIRYFIAAIVSLLAGCASVGPKVLNIDRYNYNIAMSYSSQQEILLNMVRLRYNETPMILNVGNISGSTRLDTSASAESTTLYPLPIDQANLFIGAANIAYSDNPIISYTPLEGKDFTTQLLDTVGTKDMLLLLQSSWSLARIFRLTLQQAGNALNAPNAARSTSSHAPKYKTFLDMIYVLRRLQINDDIDVQFAEDHEVNELVLQLKNHVKLTERDKKIFQKAGIEIYQHKIIFCKKRLPHTNYIVTRSIFGMLNYLSKGMQVPPIDVRKHYLDETYLPNHAVFNWEKVLQGMMAIYYSNDKKPNDAAVVIFYRGRWYYIKDSDTDSKQTMILLTNLFGLLKKPDFNRDETVGLTRNV